MRASLKVGLRSWCSISSSVTLRPAACHFRPVQTPSICRMLFLGYVRTSANDAYSWSNAFAVAAVPACDATASPSATATPRRARFR
jgi:hypothetical protein